MPVFNKLKKESEAAAIDLLNSSVAIALEKKKQYEKVFPPSEKLSEASNKFKTYSNQASNEIVSSVITTVLDELSEQSIVFDKLEYFITLHVPKIEDGGNFGVGIQLDFIKKLAETKESVLKNIQALSGYYNERADAIGKLNLPSSTKTVTKSKSVSTTDGKTEDKSSDETQEKETVNVTQNSPAQESRLLSVVAVDTLYYSKSRSFLAQSIIHFCSLMDFLDKNKDKLIEPKGKTGGSNFSMY